MIRMAAAVVADGGSDRIPNSREIVVKQLVKR